MQLINNTRASKVAKLRGEEAQRQIEDAISMETMQAYYDYSYTLGTQRLAREQVEASRDNLRQGRRMMELGLRGAADVAQLEATLASDEYNLTKVENNMRSCELKLKEVMNYPPEAAIRIDTAFIRRRDWCSAGMTGKDFVLTRGRLPAGIRISVV